MTTTTTGAFSPVLVWTGSWADVFYLSGSSLYMARVAGDGSRLDATDTVVTTWTTPALAGYDAVWTGTELGILTSRRTAASGPYQHLLFRSTATGVPLTALPTDVTPPLIARPTSGGVDLAWSTATGYVVQYGSYLEVLHADGTTRDAPFAMPMGGVVAISPTQFGILGAGTVGAETHPYLHFVAVSHDGTTVDPMVTLTDDTVTPLDQALAYDGASWVAAWTETTLTAPISNNLRLGHGPLLATRTLLGSAPRLSVASYDRCELVVADAAVSLLWEHGTVLYSPPRIDAERFDLAYAPISPVLTGILAATGSLPAVDGSGPGRLTFAWQDSRVTTADIYASSLGSVCP